MLKSTQPRQSIDHFRQKLNQLERNKDLLEDKVRKFERDIRSRSPRAWSLLNLELIWNQPKLWQQLSIEKLNSLVFL